MNINENIKLRENIGYNSIPGVKTKMPICSMGPLKCKQIVLCMKFHGLYGNSSCDFQENLPDHKFARKCVESFLSGKPENIFTETLQIHLVTGAATSNGTVPPIADNDLDKTPVSEVPSLTAEPVRQTLAPLPTQINIGETLELSPRHIDKLPPINSAKSG